jgi:hypothetical protein
MVEPVKPPSIRDLRGAARPELEALYADGPPVFVPRGLFGGHHLMWLDTPAAEHPLLRPLEERVFARWPWRIDFDSRRWRWFGAPFGVGHFSPSIGPSRWRDAETIRMLYDDRALPGFVNLFLYDEVKPLGEDVCLGLGGISARRGVGEQFFFALERLR